MSTVVFRGHRYSVPDEFTGYPCVVKGYHDHVEIWTGSTVIARHRRRYGSEEDALEPMHYIDTLRRKPGAFHHASVIRQWRAQWPEAYAVFYEALCHKADCREEKEMVEILALEREYEREVIISAMEESMHRPSVRNAEGIRQILERWDTSSPVDSSPSIRLDSYDHLIQKGGHDAAGFASPAD